MAARSIIDGNDQSQEWNNDDTIESAIMSSILSSRENNQCAADAATARLGIAASLDDIFSVHAARLRTSSRAISDDIAASIAEEKAALSEESDRLSVQLSRVQFLEHRVSDLNGTNSEMTARRRDAERSIPLHAAVASERISEIDRVECRHLRRLNKNKHELSLHALMTNITWDYSASDTASSTSSSGKNNVLKGEVALPGKAVHRRFEIEKEEMGEYEIAERLWDMIGS